MKNIFVFLLISIVLLTPTSASVVPGKYFQSIPKINLIENPINKPKQDLKLSHQELSSVVFNAKRSKLNLKEKLVVKLLGKKLMKFSERGKSQLLAFLLCLFTGLFGIHRFYLGYTWQGIVQLLTLGGFCIWTMIDYFRIAVGTLQPKDGEYNRTINLLYQKRCFEIY